MKSNSKKVTEEKHEKKQFIFNDKKLKKNRKFRKYISNNFLAKSDFKVTNKVMKHYNTIDKNDDDKQNIKKTRNPGVDLLRIISMYTIIFNHLLYSGIGGYKIFPKLKRPLFLWHSFTAWHNNAFMLISGIVGYKTNKYSNLLYLWLIVFFYSVGLYKYSLYFKKNYIIKHQIDIEYYPIIFQRYWYFTAYFGMYLFLPIINRGIQYLTKYEFTLVIITTLSLFVLWQDYKNPRGDVFLMSGGNSMIWLLIYYLPGAYIGKYRVEYFGIKKYFYCFTCLFIYSFSSYIFFKAFMRESFLVIGKFKIKLPLIILKMVNENYNSLFKVIQSISICLFLLQINYNKYLGKIICFLGPLVFGTYLIHTNKIIFVNALNTIFDKQPRDSTLNSILSLLLIKSLKTLIICLVIEYFRHLLFTLLRIKKILIFLETKMKEKFS